MERQKTFLFIMCSRCTDGVDLLTIGCVAQVLQFRRQVDVADGERWNRLSATTLGDGVVLKPLQGKNQRRMPTGNSHDLSCDRDGPQRRRQTREKNIEL